MSPTQIKLAAAEKKLAVQDAEIKTLGRQLSMAADQLARARAAKAPKLPKVTPRPKLKGDIVRMTAGDIHGAKMNKAAVAAFLADVKAIQPDEIYLLGDIVDCGGFLAQHHVLGYVPESTYTYEDDIRAANTFLDKLREAAPNAEIHFIEGNHEQRVERWCMKQTLAHGKDAGYLRRLVAPEYLLRLQEREIPYYRMGEYYDGLSVPGTLKRGSCFYTHGSFATSKNAARDVVAKFSGNVVFANTHRHDVYVGRRPNVGVVGGWNPGCLCELQPLWQNTNPTDWTHGETVQYVARTGKFLHLNVPIIDGESLFNSLVHHDAAA